MLIIETYWYAWILATFLCAAIAVARQISKIKNIDKVNGPGDILSGIGITFAFAGASWIFGIVTIISIVLNIISYVK